MKLAQVVACSLFALAVGCSNPRTQPLPDDLKQAGSDAKFQAVTQKLSAEDRELLAKYIKTKIGEQDFADTIARNGGPPAPSATHVKTVGEAIETQKRWDVESKVASEKNKATEKAYALLPKAQAAFCKAVNSYQEEYREAKAEKQNQLKLSQLRGERKQDIQEAFSENNDGVVGWLGTITRLRTDGDGKASVQVTLSCEKPIKLSTTGHIPPTSPVYKTLASLDKGKHVAVSGRFFPSEQDAIQELSLTEGGSMMEPEFRFEFSAAAVADRPKAD